MKITVLLTTVGRPTLARTLLSLRDQAWAPGDEVLLVSDDNHEAAADLFDASGVDGRHVRMQGGPHRDYGHTPRNHTMQFARGDYLCHFDDDDVALPGMIADMRAVLISMPAVHLFRMVRFKDRRKVWEHSYRLRRRNVSTQNVLHPNLPDTFGLWRPHYGGDFFFIAETVGNVGVAVWHDAVTCVYAPPPEMSAQEARDWFSRLPAAG